MKISSVSTLFSDVHAEPVVGFESPFRVASAWLKTAFFKLDRLLTAIAYAEAGNLDAVKKMLDQDKAHR